MPLGSKEEGGERRRQGRTSLRDSRRRSCNVGQSELDGLNSF